MEISKEELHAILKQPFIYLDRGAQCYVFASQDDKYVLKLFRYDQRKHKSCYSQKVESLFRACILAYTKAKEETGLVFLHLNRTQEELPILHAKSPIGQSLALSLDQYRFAIQKKTIPFGSALAEAYADQDVDRMQRMIDSFISVLQSRIEKGIRNSDPAISRNFGFLNGQAIEIDFGNYSENGVSKEKEMQTYKDRLQTWLNKHAPNTIYEN